MFLDSSPAVQEFYNSLVDLLRRGAADTLADSRCDLAAAALEDGGIPRLVCTEGGELRLKNIDGII